MLPIKGKPENKDRLPREFEQRCDLLKVKEEDKLAANDITKLTASSIQHDVNLSIRLYHMTWAAYKNSSSCPQFVEELIVLIENTKKPGYRRLKCVNVH